MPFDNFFLKEKPHHFISEEKKTHFNINSYTKLPELPNFKITYNKNSIRRLIENSSKSFITKSLKSLTLDSKFYDNYIDYYSNLTQEHNFKTFRGNKNSLLNNKFNISLKLQPLTVKDSDKEKEKIPFSKENSNPLFLTYMNDLNKDKKNLEKRYNEFNFGNRNKITKSIKAGKDFGELCDTNLFESKFSNKIGLKNIDMNNCFEEKQINYKFFYEYLKSADKFKDIFKENNFHRHLTFNRRTAIKKENMEFKLDIFSLCLKFFSLGNNNNKKKSQKLYFPFPLLPLFYLLDFTSFKIFLSEIITFNKNNNCFEFIKEYSVINKIKKYFNYIGNSLKNKNDYINNITYNKKEMILPLIYDWIVTKHIINEEDEEENIDINEGFNNNYQCYKLKIVLPKIKLSIDKLNIKINKLLNKQIIANLLKYKFNNWEKFIFFDLFSIKKFKMIMNIIMLNKYYKIPLKKINLNKKQKISNKSYEFFLTQIGDNYSLYYTFIPFVVLISFGKGKKKFQKINLSLKETINLIKFGQNRGIINTLFKCMFLDKMKNILFFKFESLEDDKNELYNIIKGENNIDGGLQNIININYDINSSNSNFKKVFSKNISLRGREKNNIIAKYKDQIYEITIFNCTLRKINITSNNINDKYYIVPSNLLDGILNINNNNVLKDNYTDIPKIDEYIGNNCKYILTAKESNNASEEKKMVNEVEIYNKDLENEGISIAPKIEKVEKKSITRKEKEINRSKTLKIIPESNIVKKDDKVENENIDTTIEKRLSSKYIIPIGLFSGRSEKKRISITNSNELNKKRFENMIRVVDKKRTFSLKKSD